MPPPFWGLRVARVRQRSSLPRHCPSLEQLEDREVLSVSPSFAAALRTLYWIAYAPSYNSSADPYNPNPSVQRITSDLQALYKEGSPGL